MAAGLAITIWPHIIAPTSLVAGPDSVIRALLGALAAVCLLGLRYPLRMLPLLLRIAVEAHPGCGVCTAHGAGPGLDKYASSTLFACLIGVILVPIVVPWGYVLKHYVKAPVTGGVGAARLPSNDSFQRTR